jgi:GNAT superfamily N-acetyltransferase
MATPQLIPVHMLREHLDQTPQFALPAPFTIRFYQPGDAETWVRVQREADQHHAITRGLFEREFGRHEPALRERQCFLCDGGGQAIGTATAWFNENYDGWPCGRVHWVAIVPSRQGQGLAKPLLSAVCNRLRELGHSRTYLITETVRVHAIKLYLKFGFGPVIRDAKDLSAWLDLRRRGLDLDVPTSTDAGARP